MNRVEFMKQLEQLLQDISENDRLDAIGYYNDYFDEAGLENEAQVIRELGSPGRVAATIKADLGTEENEETRHAEAPLQTPEEPNKKRNIPWALIIVLLVFASPVLAGVIGGVFGALAGVVAAIFGIIVALAACSVAFLASGAVCIVVGIVRLGMSPVEGLILIGIGSLLLTFGMLLLVLFVWCAFKWLPALFRGIVNLIQRIFQKERKEA